ncbi:CYTH domain-containing protein [Heyndrickxia sp. NPDC080065]|uniref:CYTH domain-containing protein n=1 Tax=Heyndrickxia sp. NPDC080065 TaxID=3390568 RepID=UPI003D062F0F
MSSEIEIEFKNLLTKEEFYRVINQFSIQENDFIEQENHYFDTQVFSLKLIGCALRIRKKKDFYELTLKQPAKVGLLETNERIDIEQVDQMISHGKVPEGEVKNRLQQLDIPLTDLVYFGTLTTKRAEVNYLNGLLVFDHSFYLKKEDFEIEYEVKDRDLGEKKFISLMNQLNIPIRQTDNKIVRFYKEKAK